MRDIFDFVVEICHCCSSLTPPFAQDFGPRREGLCLIRNKRLVLGDPFDDHKDETTFIRSLGTDSIFV